MFKSIKTLTVIFILFAVVTNLRADEKIKIKLHQPPPNQMGVGDMWNLELTNTTDKDIKIYLTGTVTEEKDGLIIEGKSKVFTLKPGRSNYKYNDFSNAEVKYNNGKYKEIILRTGNAPEGSYTICVTAFDESGTEVGRENCIMQSVQQMGGITLLTPGDGEEIDPDTLPGLMFTWTPLPKGGPYSLRIVELKGSESKEEGIRANRPIIDKEKISISSYQLGSTDPKLEAGKRYAWQVTSGETESNIQSMMILGGGGSITLTLTPTGSCNGTCCCYKINVNKTGMSSWNSFILDLYDGNSGNHNVTPHMNIPFVISTSTNGSINASPVNPPTSDHSIWKTTNGQPFTSPTQYVGDICLKKFNNNPYQIRVFWSTNEGNAWYTGSYDVITVNPSVDCPPLDCGCTNNKILNGGFTLGRVAGDIFLGPGKVNKWTSPQEYTYAKDGMGCCDDGYVTLRAGNTKVTRSKLRQITTGILPGKTYSIKFCARLSSATATNSQIKIRETKVSGVLIGTPVSVTSTNWTSFTYTSTWTPSSGYTGSSAKIVIIGSSSSASNYVDIDNVCITEVSNCQCILNGGTWGDLNVQQNSIILTLPGSGGFLGHYGPVDNLVSGSPIQITPNYTCSPGTCTPSFRWLLYNMPLTYPLPLPILSGTGAIPLNITLPSSGEYMVSLKPICGTTMCPIDSARVWLNTTP